MAPPTRPCDERPHVMYGHFCLVPRVSVHDRYYCIRYYHLWTLFVEQSYSLIRIRPNIYTYTCIHKRTIKLVMHARMNPHSPGHPPTKTQHTLIHSLTHSLARSLAHSLIHSFTHSIIHSFIHSLIHSFTHSLIHSFTHSFIHSFTHSLIHSFTHSLIHSFTLSLIHSFTHSLIHSLMHSLTQSQYCLPGSTHYHSSAVKKMTETERIILFLPMTCTCSSGCCKFSVVYERCEAIGGFLRLWPRASLAVWQQIILYPLPRFDKVTQAANVVHDTRKRN